MKPSDLDVISVPPFVGLFRRSECEAAVAAVVRSCQFHGDEWKPIGTREICATVEHDINTDGAPLFWSNPFYRPDFEKAVENMWLEWVGTGDERKLLVTDSAKDVLRLALERKA